MLKGEISLFFSFLISTSWAFVLRDSLRRLYFLRVTGCRNGQRRACFGGKKGHPCHCMRSLNRQPPTTISVWPSKQRELLTLTCFSVSALRQFRRFLGIGKNLFDLACDIQQITCFLYHQPNREYGSGHRVANAQLRCSGPLSRPKHPTRHAKNKEAVRFGDDGH